MGSEAELVRPRLARGCRCFAVILDGTIAGYGWLSTGPEWIGELQREIRPRKAEAYIWNCVTLPEHRRKGIFRSLVVGIAEAARQTGVRRVWIGSVAIPAENALPPLGFRAMARFRTVQFLGLVVLTGPKIIDSDARRVVSSRSGIGAELGRLEHRKH